MVARRIRSMSLGMSFVVLLSLVTVAPAVAVPVGPPTATIIGQIAYGDRRVELSDYDASPGTIVRTRFECTSDTGVRRVRTFDGLPTNVDIEWLTPGATYTCRLKAENEAGWGDWGPDSDESDPIPGPPSAPVIAGAFEDGIRAAYVAWYPATANGADVDRYKYWCWTGDPIVHERLRNHDPTYVAPDSYFTMPYLKGGREYWCAVRARNENGWGPWSDPFGPILVRRGVFTWV